MKNIIFTLAMLFFSTLTMAAGTVQLYKVTGDRADEGIRLGADFDYGTVGLSLQGNGSSFDFGLGKSFGALRLNAGFIRMFDGQSEYQDVDVTGTMVSGKSTQGEGSGYFVEVKYKMFFVRRIVADLSRTYNASRVVGSISQINPLPPILLYDHANKTVETTNQYTMVGINFPF